ncbi:MAG: 3-dehydroquinate synthase [Rhodospirillales bacterium]
MNNSTNVESVEPPLVVDPDRLRVELGARAYDIVVGRGLIERAGSDIAPLLNRPRTLIVTDANVARGWLQPLERALMAAGIETASVVLPPGEATKSFGQLERLCGEILDWRIERRSTVVALGGGVIGDLVGFAAAILMRGIEFIQIPTTLLAQVDSSVGGKTGINMPQGKNLIGAFHQPRLVLADTAALDTLPDRELGAGYAEIAKYGLLGDKAFYEWLEDNGAGFFDGDEQVRRHAILESCRAKARIVGEDEKETGKRALLNLGHTFGHALEAEAGYDGRLLHGEAVGIGMVMAFRLSALLGHCDQGDADRVATHLRSVGVPADLSGLDTANWTAARLLDHMRIDKKVQDGRLTFILARAIGEAFISSDVPEAAVLETLETALQS